MSVHSCTPIALTRRLQPMELTLGVHKNAGISRAKSPLAAFGSSGSLAPAPFTQDLFSKVSVACACRCN